MSAASTSSITGWGPLLRFALRRDKIRTLAWTAGMGIGVYASIAAVITAYPDEAALHARVELSQLPASALIAGPLFHDGQPTLGAVVNNELLALLLLTVAIVSILTTVRHTRADEELGRTELVRALPVGRHAPALAAVANVAILNVLIAAVSTAAYLAEGFSTVDSLGVGAALLTTGVMFAALAGVFSQIASHARTATGLSFAALGGAFALRAVGDVIEPTTGSWVSWLSPLAWGQQMRHYADLRWWPLALSIALIAVLIAAALLLGARRDFGAGLRPDAAGDAEASSALLRQGGLARRLLRSSFTIWLTGTVALMALLGSMAYVIEDVLEQLPEIGEWLGAQEDALVQSFVALGLSYGGLIVICSAASGMARLRAEEQASRLSTQVVAGTSRGRLLGWWTATVLAQSLVMLGLGALALGLSASLSVGDWSLLGDVLRASLAYVPVVIAVVAIAAVLFGVTPRWFALTWAAVGWAALVTFLGDVLNLGEVARNASVIYLAGAVPLEDPRIGVLTGLTVGAVIAYLIGARGFRDRDLTD